MTWSELADEHERAAKLLREKGLFRDAVSRIYYAMYSLAASEVRKFGPFVGGMWDNPPHSQVPALISRLTGHSHSSRKEMASIFKELVKKRVDPDYQPSVIIDETVARKIFGIAERFKELIENGS